MVGQEILVLFIMVRIRALQPKIQPAFAGLIFGRARIGQSNAVAHDQYENTQLEKSQKSQEQDFCRFLFLRIEVRAHSRE